MARGENDKVLLTGNATIVDPLTGDAIELGVHYARRLVEVVFDKPTVFNRGQPH